MNDIFNDIKKRWIDLLAIAIASGLTPSMIQWLGWTNNFWTFIVVFLIIAIVVGIVVGLVMALIKKNKE
jgi:hypothetical protein